MDTSRRSQFHLSSGIVSFPGMDFLTTEERSRLMSRIRGRNTNPERIVRRLVRQLGYTFKTYHPSLPAKPDLVFPSQHKVILVHGCFWHRHYRCPKATTPKTRVRFWRNKFAQNKRRDRQQLILLRNRGWKSMVLWECETQFPDRLRDRIRRYLGDSK